MNKLIVLIGIFYLVNSISTQNPPPPPPFDGSANILGVNIRWKFLNERTSFFVTTQLANGVNVNDAWLGIGLNSVEGMVNTFLEKVNY